MRTFLLISWASLALCDGAREQQPLRRASGLAGYSPNGEQIFIAGNHDVAIFDAEEGALLHTLAGHQDRIVRVEYRGDGRRLLTVSDDRTTKIWDAASGKLLFSLNGHRWTPYCTPFSTFSPDGRRLVTAGLDETAQLWDAETGWHLGSFDAGGDHVSAAIFSPDGGELALAVSTTVQVWSIAKHARLFSLRSEGSSLFDHYYSPDGAQLVVRTSGGKYVQGKTKIWNARTGENLFTFWELHAEYSPDGTQLLRGDLEGESEVIDPKTGVRLFGFDGSPNLRFGRSYSSGGGEIVTFTRHLAKVWSARSGEARLVLDVEHPSWPLGLRFSPDGTQLAAAYHDGSAKAWNARTGELLFEFGPRLRERLEDLQYSPDGKRIALVATSGTTFVWSAKDGELQFVLHSSARGASKK